MRVHGSKPQVERFKQAIKVRAPLLLSTLLLYLLNSDRPFQWAIAVCLKEGVWAGYTGQIGFFRYDECTAFKAPSLIGMTNTTRTVKTAEQSKFQQAIDLVESLPMDDQAVLVNLIQKRLHQQRRNQLVQEVKAAETEYAQGNVHRGTIADLMAELDG